MQYEKFTNLRRLVDNERVISSAASETPSPIPPPRDKEISLSATPLLWFKQVIPALVTPTSLSPDWLLSVHQSNASKLVDRGRDEIMDESSQRHSNFKLWREERLRSMALDFFFCVWSILFGEKRKREKKKKKSQCTQGVKHSALALCRRLRNKKIEKKRKKQRKQRKRNCSPRWLSTFTNAHTTHIKIC